MALDDLFFISTAAEQLGMHPQTLRKYERLGLIRPSRTIGSMRLYAREELERLRLIKQMVDGHGINLAGVQRRPHRRVFGCPLYRSGIGTVPAALCCCLSRRLLRDSRWLG